jgi:hypothetical protein
MMLLRQMQKALKGILALGIVVAISVAAYLTYRNNQMDRLYLEAIGYPPFFKSSGESTAALRKLSSYRGRRASEMLLDVALGRGPAGEFLPETQEEAIKLLGERKDPKVALSLAKLLQPHEGLAIRKAVALGLKYPTCKDECVRLILHYLERVWRGDPNHEDRWTGPSGRASVTANVRKEQEILYADLYVTLKSARAETLTSLADIYGLGTADPSPFALDVVSRLGSDDACPYLVQSDEALKNLSPEFYKAPRLELRSAIASLGCRPPT